jgi:hypothetical protein
MSKPNTFALPDVGLIRPNNVLIVVDFPAPFGPIKPKKSPLDTQSSKSVIPLLAPYVFVSLLVSIAFIYSSPLKYSFKVYHIFPLTVPVNNYYTPLTIFEKTKKVKPHRVLDYFFNKTL